MKTYIRTLWGDDAKPLWDSEAERDLLRTRLNDMGFYVLTGAGDALDVYALDDAEAWDIQILKKTLDKIKKVWHT